jgi:hypothetical protein
VVDYRWRKERSGKEGSEMLPLEAIGVLGFLYLFFMYGTLKALRARKTVHLKANKAKPKPAVMDMAPETAKQTV